MKFNLIQNLDYERNSHFTKYIPENRLFSEKDEIEIFELIKKIDVNLNFFLNKANSRSAEDFRLSIVDEVNQFKNLLLLKNDSDIYLIASQLVDFAVDRSAAHIKLKVNSVKVDDLTDERLPKLKKDGFYEFNIPKSDEFDSICNELMFSHKKMYENEVDWRGANAFECVTKKDKYFLFFEKYILDNKIDELISQYHGAKCRIKYIASDYCHSRQQWFKNNHEGQGLIKTNYVHFDADPNISKMLIYLSDVTENDGPFQIVRGSNLQQISLFLKYIHFGLEVLNSEKFAKGGDFYGRGLHVERKDLLMKLPIILIGATHFGDDLIEGSMLYNYIVDNMVSFNRNKGACVLFDGFAGLHTGGNPKNGERLAVQVAFEYEVNNVKKRKSWFRK